MKLQVTRRWPDSWRALSELRPSSWKSGWFRYKRVAGDFEHQCRWWAWPVLAPASWAAFQFRMWSIFCFRLLGFWDPRIMYAGDWAGWWHDVKQLGRGKPPQSRWHYFSAFFPFRPWWYRRKKACTGPRPGAGEPLIPEGTFFPGRSAQELWETPQVRTAWDHSFSRALEMMAGDPEQMTEGTHRMNVRNDLGERALLYQVLAGRIIYACWDPLSFDPVCEIPEQEQDQDYENLMGRYRTEDPGSVVE